MEKAMAKSFTVEPGRFAEAAQWVMDQIMERERERVRPASFIAQMQVEPPSYTPIPKPLSKLLIGLDAHMEGLHSHKSLGIWTVDYMDRNGPRIRISDLVAEPTRDVNLWEIQVS